MTHRLGIASTVLGLSLAFTACGSDDNDTAPARETVATQVSASATTPEEESSTTDAPVATEASSDAAPTTAPAAAVTDRALRVGLVTTLSGPAGYYGQDILDGFNLAIKLADANIEVIVEDDEQDADTGLQAVQRLLEREDVDVITGPAFSNVILAVAPEVLEAGKIFIGPNGGPSQYAGADCDPAFFNVAFQTDVLAESTGQYMTESGVTNPYIVTLDYQAGYDNVSGLKRTYTGDIAGEQYVPLGTTDFASIIAEIAASSADSLYVFLPGGPGIAFMQQYAASGDGRQIYANAANTDAVISNVVGEASVGAVGSATWGFDVDNPANTAFVEAFVDEYGRRPEMYGMQGYDAGQLLIGSLEILGGVPDDLDDLIPVMQTAPFDSPRGDFAFGINNFPIQSWYMREVILGEDGAITYETIDLALENYGDAYAAECDFG